MVWGHTQIYPNQYIVLVGPSGVRKGEPLVLARHFLREVGIPLISDAVTRQSLVQTIANGVKNFSYGNGIRLQCPISGVFEEFAVFLGEGDAKFLTWLTQWYDSRERFVYETKGSGTDEVLGVCANILGSTAPDWFPLIIPATAVGGGFTSRVIWVVEHRKGRIIEDPNEIQIDRKLEADLVHDLEQVRTIVGPFEFSPDALETYKAWYRHQEEEIAAGKPPIRDPRFSGYVSRRATHVKKLAMASSVSRGDDRVVEDFDFRRALAVMESAEQSMPAVFSSVGRSLYSIQTESVLEFIRNRGEATRSEVLKLMYYDLDVRTLEVVEENLEAMRLIKLETNTSNGEVVYKWKGPKEMVSRAPTMPKLESPSS